MKKKCFSGLVLGKPWAWAEDLSGALDSSQRDLGLVGYSVDFLERLAKELNVDYVIHVSDDYGYQNQNGDWNGIMGDLLASSLKTARPWWARTTRGWRWNTTTWPSH